ncbi:hypothetical protein [Bacillus sp. V5-8f]|uniref:hypothetical protein n=1 Tax=Bacillus sp. V5-8f TaxID=2053044 RepID=UPI000C77B781|nr:hypothetical protein [Bacillus sp. V5-8f]PLT34989.1 hypothetical protein CUU64_06250 [Bacillus sp. V5-8f]
MTPIRRFFTKKEPIRENMDKRINLIEKTLKTIETNLSQISDESASSLFKQLKDELELTLQQQITSPPKSDKKDLRLSDAKNPPIIIEQLRVDKIVVQKLEYSNNFGQLGIQELKGKLNIGTSHEGEIKTEKAEKAEKMMSKLHEKISDIPEIKLQPRKE